MMDLLTATLEARLVYIPLMTACLFFPFLFILRILVV